MATFDFQKFLEFILVEFRIFFFNNRIFIVEEFEEVWFIKVGIFIQTMIFQIVFVNLFDLRVETLILKFTWWIVRGFVLNVEVNKTRSSTHELWNLFH